MKAISRRLDRLEDKFGLVETEEMRIMAQRIEEGRQRAAEWRAREGLPPQEPKKKEDLSGLTIVEILNQGRARARARALAEEERIQHASTGEPPAPG